jgi:hypothetical protein
MISGLVQSVAACPAAGLDELLPPAGSREGEYAGGAMTADPANPRAVYAVVPTCSYLGEPGGSFRGTADPELEGATIVDAHPTRGHRQVTALRPGKGRA